MVGQQNILLKPLIDDTIHEVIKLLQDKIAIKYDQIRLYILETGKPLMPNKRIFDYNLHDGSHIQAYGDAITDSEISIRPKEQITFPNHFQISTVIDYWCQLLDIDQIEKVLFDIIAI